MKPTGTSETLAQLRLKRCPDEDLDELDEEAMKHIANLQKRRSIVLMVSLSSPLFLEGANFLGTGLYLGRHLRENYNLESGTIICKKNHIL